MIQTWYSIYILSFCASEDAAVAGALRDARQHLKCSPLHNYRFTSISVQLSYTVFTQE